MWGNKLEYYLTCISMSVGLGNIWKFPYVMYNNNGIIFLITYFIVLFLVGIPIYFLETFLGQFSGYNAIDVWEIYPIFKGIGVVSLIASMIISTYYCSIIAIAFYYFFNSFVPLPWYNNTEEYFNNIFDGCLGINVYLILCLMLTWTIIGLSLFKGIRIYSKISYITSILPYLILFIFLIKMVTLESSVDGIRHLFKTEYDVNTFVKSIGDSIGQCIFSLNLGFGVITTLASHNNFNYNIKKNVFVICCIDFLTSILSSVITMGNIGFIAHKHNKTIDESVKHGPDLIFKTYPEIILNFPYPNLFSILFFLMLIILGLGSAIALVNVIITILVTKFKNLSVGIITLFVCLIGFVCGIIYLLPRQHTDDTVTMGFIILDFVDFYGVILVITCILLLTLIILSYGYGVNKLTRDVEFMTKKKLEKYWKMSWVSISPILLLFSVITTLWTRFDKNEYIMLIIGMFLTFIIITGPVGLMYYKKKENNIKWRPKTHTDAYNEII